MRTAYFLLSILSLLLFWLRGFFYHFLSSFGHSKLQPFTFLYMYVQAGRTAAALR